MNTTQGQFGNVYNLAASRDIKEKTGKGAAVRATTPESPEFKQHADEALAINTPPKRSLFDKTMDYLGMTSK